MSEQSTKVVAVNDENFTAIMNNTDLPLLLEFWAPWCHHCQMLSPVIDQVAVELAGKVVVAQVNCDLSERLPEKFNVEVIPTLFLIRAEEVLGTIVNPKDKASLLSWVGELIG
ncbi:MAG: thioredoxin [Deltaproteobacteria bacterium]|nr:thioredoxin [Deltaproteobacteria bacterium]TLN04422.1 MAG: thioredoxin [bacterium]